MKVPSISYKRPANMDFVRLTAGGLEIMVQEEMAKHGFDAEIYLEKVLFFRAPAVRGIKNRLERP